jgi:hypothetical protein
VVGEESVFNLLGEGCMRGCDIKLELAIIKMLITKNEQVAITKGHHE